MEYVLAPEAELDLKAIWDYIADDNFEAADRWLTNCSTPLKRWPQCQRSGTRVRI